MWDDSSPMPTRIYLIRHALTDAIGVVLTSRTPGIDLNADGRVQAAALPRRFAGITLAAVYASPMERTQQTAAPLAEAYGVPVQTLAGVNEVIFGDWTNRRLDDLERDPVWRRYNERRSLWAPPLGESLLQVQARAVVAIEEVRARHGGQAVAIVSHGDVVRALVMLYLGMPADFSHRVAIEPASISIVDFADDGAPRVVGVNLLGPLV